MVQALSGFTHSKTIGSLAICGRGQFHYPWNIILSAGILQRNDDDHVPPTPGSVGRRLASINSRIAMAADDESSPLQSKRSSMLKKTTPPENRRILSVPKAADCVASVCECLTEVVKRGRPAATIIRALLPISQQPNAFIRLYKSCHALYTALPRSSSSLPCRTFSCSWYGWFRRAPSQNAYPSCTIVTSRFFRYIVTAFGEW